MSTHLNVLRDARILADHIADLSDFPTPLPHRAGWSGHLGAILADSVLQSGLHYTNVVRPRVERVAAEQCAATLSGFSALIHTQGAVHILYWKSPEKPNRLLRLIALLTSENVETTSDLRDWLRRGESRPRLLTVPGIGPKTVDYLAALAGLPTVAVDRHVSDFAFSAGVRERQYDRLKRIVEYSADLLGVCRAGLDRSIWTYQSSARDSSRSATEDGHAARALGSAIQDGQSYIDRSQLSAGTAYSTWFAVGATGGMGDA